jgi:hypothetical protein
MASGTAAGDNKTRPKIEVTHLLYGAVLGAGLLNGIFLSTHDRYPLLLILLAGLAVLFYLSVKDAVLFLVILVIFVEGAFSLKVIGKYSALIEEGALFLFILFTILRIPVLVSNLNRFSHKNAKWILMFLVIVILSEIFGSYLRFGQPIQIGLFTSRHYFRIGIYFFLATVTFRKEEADRFLLLVSLIGLSLAVLILIDTILFNTGVIFHVERSLERLGEVRFNVSTYLIAFSAIMLFIRGRDETRRKWRLFYLGAVGICLADLVYCSQTRAVILALFITLTVIEYRKSRKVVFAAIALFLFSITYVASDDILSTRLGGLIKHTQEEAAANRAKNPGNIKIRMQSYKYYIHLWITLSPVFGIGTFSKTRFANDPEFFAQENFGFHLSDVYGIDTFVRFGALGLAFLVMFYFKVIRDLVWLLDRTGKQGRRVLESILFITIYTMLSPTLGNLLTPNYLFFTGIFLAIIQSMKNELTQVGAG